MNIRTTILLLTFFILPLSVDAQTFEKIIEFLTIYPNKKAVEKDSSLYPAKAIFTPVVSFAPETNLSFGVYCLCRNGWSSSIG